MRKRPPGRTQTRTHPSGLPAWLRITALLRRKFTRSDFNECRCRSFAPGLVGLVAAVSGLQAAARFA